MCGMLKLDRGNLAKSIKWFRSSVDACGCLSSDKYITGWIRASLWKPGQSYPPPYTHLIIEPLEHINNDRFYHISLQLQPPFDTLSSQQIVNEEEFPLIYSFNPYKEEGILLTNIMWPPGNYGANGSQLFCFTIHFSKEPWTSQGGGESLYGFATHKPSTCSVQADQKPKNLYAIIRL